MTVSLPDRLKEFVEKRVASGEFPSAEAYLGSLVDADRLREERDRLDDMLLEGLNSPNQPMTSEDWNSLRRRIREHATGRMPG